MHGRFISSAFTVRAKGVGDAHPAEIGGGGYLTSGFDALLIVTGYVGRWES